MSDKLNIGDDGHEKSGDAEKTPKTIDQDGKKGVTEKELSKDLADTDEKNEEERKGKAEGKISERVEAETKKKDAEDNKTETILSSQSLKSSDPSISITTDPPTTPNANPSQKTFKDRCVNRNQSDILPSLRELPPDEDASLMIFSSKGQPSKKCIRRREVNSTVLPFGFNEKDEKGAVPATHRVRAEAELTPKISQRVPKHQNEEKELKKAPFGDKNPNISNPSVTGNVCGVGGEAGCVRKSARRKDGNPVLGLGYEDPVVTSNVGRVPPGGFSSGLW